MSILVLMLVGLVPPQGSVCDRVLEFARSKLGQKVGDGECSALAAAALRYAGATKRGRAWGEELGSIGDVRPGDILQFEGVTFVRNLVREDGAVLTLNFAMPHHTAIVSGVGKRGKNLRVKVLHQNAGFEGVPEDERRVVQEWTLDTAEMKGGKVRAYRPVAIRSMRPSSPAAQPTEESAKSTTWNPASPSGFHDSPPSAERSEPVGPTATNVAFVPGTKATAER